MTTRHAPNANPNAHYRQVAQHYRDLIDSGDLKTGQKMPTVDEVAAEREVSRSTAHKALCMLTDSGYTHSKQGGSYVLMGGVTRLYAVLEETIKALDNMDQKIVLRGNSEIRGKDGAVARNKQTGAWERRPVA